MSWLNVVVLLILGGAWVVSSLIKARASLLLTREQSNQVSTVWGLRRAARMLLVAYACVLLVVLGLLGVPFRPVNFYVQVVVVAGVVAWSHVTYFRRLRALNLPAAYLDALRRARMVVYGSSLIFLAILVYEDVR
ncbi:MAG TPA: hypothetical protein VGV60_03185 [Candidatus Polarisedimenticolia bacterium]|nr:hypothetical protein [Candidatus Polarisedimenticolia bacterium]